MGECQQRCGASFVGDVPQGWEPNGKLCPRCWEMLSRQLTWPKRAKPVPELGALLADKSVPQIARDAFEAFVPDGVKLH